MIDRVVNPVNVVGGAMLAQVSLLAIMLVAGLIVRRSDRYARLYDKPTLAGFAWLTLTLALISLGSLGTTDAFSEIWLPLFNQEEWRSPITWSHALLITFVLDILVVTYFVFGTGGSRESPFQALYFLIPTLAVFLREPVSRVVFYVTLVAIAYSVTSLIANDNHDEARDTRQNLAHWFVSVASFVAAAVIGLLTRPL
jgi:hypothetical protein